MIISCTKCGARNKISKEKMHLGPKCGRCKASLDCSYAARRESQSSAVAGRPATVRESSPSGSGPGHIKVFNVGDLIAGRYKIRDVLGGEGKSSMGVVYVCHDSEYDQIVALKTLQDRYLDSKKVLDNFKKEALAWIYLEKHPYIVRAMWVRELDDRMFIACEYIAPDLAGRTSLTSHLTRPFSLKRTLTWAIQFCHGMEYAVSRGIRIHRDIKPDNILITPDGDVKITDFGLVGLWDRTDRPEEINGLIQKNRKGLTFLTSFNNRIVAGSPPWMAPEQFYGVARRAGDIYSFGVVLYQMVSNGELPFHPKRGDRWATAHKKYPIPDVPDRSKPLKRVIQRCLQKRRDKRYGDFSELRSDLEGVFKKEITKRTHERAPMPPEIEKLKGSERINEGLSFANLGLFDEAIRQYREGLRRHPGNPAGHYNLGNALAGKGSLDEAIKEYREALSIDPDMTAAHFNLGMVLMRKGRPDEAIEAYRKALKCNPDLAEAYVNMGVAYSSKGMSDNAIKAFKAAIRSKPEFAEAHCKLGLSFFRQGLLDEAISAFGKAISLKSDYADAYYNLGITFIKKEFRTEAVRAFEEFVRCAGPDDSRIEKAKTFAEKLRNGRR